MNGCNCRTVRKPRDSNNWVEKLEKFKMPTIDLYFSIHLEFPKDFLKTRLMRGADSPLNSAVFKVC